MFKDKFIAFVDILGFKGMVAAAETAAAGGEPNALRNLLALLTKLGTVEDVRQYRIHGPIFCPESPRLEPGLDFQLTQISDCVIASAEVSPAGVINLVGHCWSAVSKLLREGVLCRGYITRGSVHHTASQVIGTGYQHALRQESQVAVFKTEADERGTPFVAIDDLVAEYVRTAGGVCVQRLFGEMTATDGEVTAVFPFKQLQHSFAFENLERCKELRSNDNIRQWITDIKSRVLAAADAHNPVALRKTEHYIRALDVQLNVCDQTAAFLGRPHK